MRADGGGVLPGNEGAIHATRPRVVQRTLPSWVRRGTRKEVLWGILLILGGFNVLRLRRHAAAAG